MDITCQTVCNNISDYVDNEVSRTQKTAMAHHLATCRRCAAIHAAILNIIALYRDDRLLAPSPEFHDHLRDKLEQRMANCSGFLSSKSRNPRTKS